MHQPDQFCSNCGQRSDTHRLTIPHLAHDFFHALTHADKSIFSLLAQLATRPGAVARDYIAGKRKRYFNPPREKWAPDPAVLARIPTEEGKANYVLMSSRSAELSGFIQRNGNLVAMIAIPFIALITWSFYRETNYNYAEFFTATLLFVTFSNLFFTLIVYPLQSFYKGTTVQASLPIVGLLLQIVYYTWCYGRFADVPPARARWVKAFGVSFVAVLSWMLLSLLAMSLYMYRGWDFYKFFVRMAS